MTLLLEDGIKTMFSYAGDHAEIHVTHEGEDTFRVVWGDYVANAWEETYDDLSNALARAAVLVAGCAMSESWGFIQPDAESFSQAWQDTLMSMIDGYGDDSEDEV